MCLTLRWAPCFHNRVKEATAQNNTKIAQLDHQNLGNNPPFSQKGTAQHCPDFSGLAWVRVMRPGFLLHFCSLSTLCCRVLWKDSVLKLFSNPLQDTNKHWAVKSKHSVAPCLPSRCFAGRNICRNNEFRVNIAEFYRKANLKCIIIWAVANFWQGSICFPLTWRNKTWLMESHWNRLQKSSIL